MKFVRISILLLYVHISLNVHSQNFNRPVPYGILYPYEFVQYDTADYGYYLTAPYKTDVNPNNPGYVRPRAVLLDKNGYVLWFSMNSNFSIQNFQFQPVINKFSVYFQYGPTHPNNHFGLLDSALQFSNSYIPSGNLPVDMHEFQILSNGNAVYFVRKDSLMDLSAYLFGSVQGSDSTHVECYVLQEFDTANNLVFEWNSIDHIYPTEAYSQYGYSAASFDYCHGNAIDEDADGNLLISFRHLNSVYKIDHSNGNVLWRLCGKSSSFNFPNDLGFGGQHDIRRLASGSYSLFDNTNTIIPHQSRAVIYSLDTNAWTATRIWLYKPVPTFYSTAMGNHQVTDNLNHLVNYGNNKRPYPSFELVDDNGNKISQVFFEDSVISYRSSVVKLPFVFPRPQITCSAGVNSITLYAPSGYQEYIWSDGSTGDHITVSSPGVYQVWVTYGIGMLGSEPFIINDISTACSSTGIKEEQTISLKGSYTVFDLLGRTIKYPVAGHLYIFRYAAGNAELKYYTATY